MFGWMLILGILRERCVRVVNTDTKARCHGLDAYSWNTEIDRGEMLGVVLIGDRRNLNLGGFPCGVMLLPSWVRQGGHIDFSEIYPPRFYTSPANFILKAIDQTKPY